jgi:hypothetical protein
MWKVKCVLQFSTVRTDRKGVQGKKLGLSNLHVCPHAQAIEATFLDPKLLAWYFETRDWGGIGRYWLVGGIALLDIKPSNGYPRNPDGTATSIQTAQECGPPGNSF